MVKNLHSDRSPHRGTHSVLSEVGGGKDRSPNRGTHSVLSGWGGGARTHSTGVRAEEQYEYIRQLQTSLVVPDPVGTGIFLPDPDPIFYILLKVSLNIFNKTDK